MNFQAIIFDYGNVLAGRPGSDANNNLINLLEVSPEAYAKAYFSYNRQVNTGKISWEQLWELVLGDLGKLDKLPIALEQNKTYEASLENINTEVAELAVRLKAQGYKIGVLSNTTPSGAVRIHKKLEPYHFDAVHCSAETGNVKPDREAFTGIANALSIDIHKMVFIDDSPRSLSTAQQCGFTPILFNGYRDLLEQLRSLGF